MMLSKDIINFITDLNALITKGEDSTTYNTDAQDLLNKINSFDLEDEIMQQDVYASWYTILYILENLVEYGDRLYVYKDELLSNMKIISKDIELDFKILNTRKDDSIEN